MRFFVCMTLMLIASCTQNSVRVVDIPSNQEFTLKIGEQASVDNGSLFIRFTDVVEDSRCPMNARCIWAGNGKIAIEIQKTNSDEVTRSLDTTLEPQSTEYDSYEILFKMLMPAPMAGEEIRREDYRATLLVTTK